MIRSFLQAVAFALLITLGTNVFAAEDDATAKRRAEYSGEKNGPKGDCDGEWQSLDRGLHYRAITCLGGKETDMHLVRFDPEIWSLDTAVADGATARGVARDKDAPFAINANFFGKGREALGLIVRSGKQVQPPRSSSWQSIFMITEDGRAKILMPSNWSEQKSSARMAVQAGPRLVINGHTNRVHQSYRAARCGVCIEKSGNVIFFATPSSRQLDMYEIARIARRGVEDGGMHCRDAMLFDGGHSTQLYLATERKDLSITGDAVPVLIYGKKD
ncbi:MAG TPA: phosphodiester glycosidase family protein [Thermoanaerobaculia bacterium]|nr:phosphodiester glycosidase family protein [Thermoanaerobaculia bacterium]